MSHGLDINRKDSQVVRIPFLDETDLRPGQEGSYTKDRYFLNGYFEPIKSPLTSEVELHFTKRPGTSRNTLIGNGLAGRRIYFWKATNKFYVVTTTTIWNSDIGDLNITLAPFTGRSIGIAETRPGASPQYLGVNTGNALYLIGVDNSVIVLNGVAITSSSVANPTTIITVVAHGLNTG